jgi:hypothetical protein
MTRAPTTVFRAADPLLGGETTTFTDSDRLTHPVRHRLGRLPTRRCADVSITAVSVRRLSSSAYAAPSGP